MGNASTATVKIYRRHRVRVVSPDEQTTYAEAELAHNEYLVLTMKMPDGAAVRMTDKADHSEIPYDKEMGRFTVGLIDRSRTLVLEYNTEYPKAELILGAESVLLWIQRGYSRTALSCGCKQENG